MTPFLLALIAGIAVFLALTTHLLYERRILSVRVKKEIGYEHITVKNITWIYGRRAHAVYILLKSATINSADIDGKPVARFHIVTPDDSLHDLLAMLLSGERVALKYKDRYVICAHRHLLQGQRMTLSYFGQAKTVKAFPALTHVGGGLGGLAQPVAPVPFEENRHDSLSARATHLQTVVLSSDQPSAALVSAAAVLRAFLEAPIAD